MGAMQRRIELRRRRAALPAPNADGDAAQRTDRLLGRLGERDWDVIADLDPRYGLDHVLVGPGGVFAIASQMPPGVGAARVKDGMLWLRRGSDPRADRPGAAINRQVLESAKALHKEIRARTGRGPVVRPVVVLWCEFPQAVAESSRIAFVRGRDLLDWLSHRPQQLDLQGRDEIAQAVRAIPSNSHALRRWHPLQRASRRGAA
jgi:Nuclease-related domain